MIALIAKAIGEELMREQTGFCCWELWCGPGCTKPCC